MGCERGALQRSATVQGRTVDPSGSGRPVMITSSGAYAVATELCATRCSVSSLYMQRAVHTCTHVIDVIDSMIMSS